MLVTQANKAICLAELLNHKNIGFDTETYGIGFFDEAFSLQFSCSTGSFYINLHDYEDGTPMLTRAEVLEFCTTVFNSVDTVFIHNAKFDLRRLELLGLKYFTAKIHCSMQIERVIYNQHMRYSLDACLKRRDRSKNDEVSNYIKEHKLYRMVTVAGKQKRVKEKYYWKVPFDIMFKYGLQDAMDVLFLGADQLATLAQMPELASFVQNEYELTKACARMESIGILTNQEYVQEGLEYETERLSTAKREASTLAQEEYRNGPKWLASSFDRLGQPYKRNDKTGNPIFDKSALADMQSPIANVVKRIRASEKYISTYYSSFQYFAIDDIVHANINLAGTDTMRFSYSDPNLQNVPKEEKFAKGDIQVRKCFIPRADHCFVMIDFDQQEFRLMLDYAGEKALIKRINEEGADVHQATADLCRIERKFAKTLNFGLLYGMGVEKLAKALGISQRDAQDLKFLYFSRMPSVEKLIGDVIKAAKYRGYIKSWSGRRMYFPDKELCYKAPNHLIQGGCADIARLCIPRLDKELMNCKSNLLLQVHDELIFEVHKDELDIVPRLRAIMEATYIPQNGMNLTCGVEYSWESWGKQDAIEGIPT